jgi:hypothetical protein
MRWVDQAPRPHTSPEPEYRTLRSRQRLCAGSSALSPIGDAVLGWILSCC